MFLHGTKIPKVQCIFPFSFCNFCPSLNKKGVQNFCSRTKHFGCFGDMKFFLVPKTQKNRTVAFAQITTFPFASCNYFICFVHNQYKLMNYMYPFFLLKLSFIFRLQHLEGGKTMLICKLQIPLFLIHRFF